MNNKIQYLKFVIEKLSENNPYGLADGEKSKEYIQKGIDALEKISSNDFDLSKISINFETLHIDFELGSENSYEKWKVRTRKEKINNILKR